MSYTCHHKILMQQNNVGNGVIEMVDILIENGVIVTMDGRRRIIGEQDSNGAVAIEGDSIVDVGTTKELREKYDAKRVIGASDKVVMPGLIDCHGHSFDWLFRDDDQYLHIVKCATEEEQFTQGLLSAVGRLRFGTTCGVTMVERFGEADYPSKIAEATEKAGTRAVITGEFGSERPIRDRVSGLDRDALEDFLENAEIVIKKWHNKGGGRIQVWLGAAWIGGADQVGCFRPIFRIDGWETEGVPQFTDDDFSTCSHLGKRFRAVADKYDTNIHVHAYRGMVKFAYECDPEAWLGPDVLVAHCIGLTDEEIGIFGKTDTKVAHCPHLYGLEGHSPMRLPEMIDNGVTVGLGTDHGGPGVSYDMFKEMRAAMMLQRLTRGDGRLISPGKALEMATIDAARALQQDERIGSIEFGKKADIILMDLLKPHLTSRFDLPSRIVYEANGLDVDTVLVDGEILMLDGEILRVDEKQLVKQASAEVKDLVERADIQILARRPRDYWRHSRF